MMPTTVNPPAISAAAASIHPIGPVRSACASSVWALALPVAAGPATIRA
jgi:hypothetical protein